MKKIVIIALLIFLTKSLFSDIFPSGYQSDILFHKLETLSNDSKASALGNCSLLSGKGSNNIFVNPANLGNIEQIMVGINFEVQTKKYEYEYESYLTSGNKKNDNAYSYSVKGFSIAIPIDSAFTKNRKTGLGIGLQRIFDLNYKATMNANMNNDLF